ncbi:MAG: 1-acyl-sn-glycerol-3-phosphate acyltransferase [Deltaproteobacteria bacterium]|nr:1-acyl-sn-glycerol-3-phosphate acyltransferase [Deltaproteobacteria bacterium]
MTIFGSSGDANEQGGRPRWGDDPALVDPELIARAMRLTTPLFGPGGPYEVSFEGWEHLPDAPALVVGNHSGGTTVPDSFGLGYAWTGKHGTNRPLMALGHDMIFRMGGPVGRTFAKFGGLRATPDMGRTILAEHHKDLLVYPGGDKDVWRPFSRRHQVTFAGRKGYARLALAAGVPIVPIAHCGSHQSFVVLTDGTPVARALGIHNRFRAEVFPVHLSLPWGLAVGPWPHLPLPVRFRYRMGAPVYPPAGADPRDPEAIAAFDAAARASLQAELDALAETAPTPAEQLAHIRETGRRLAEVGRDVAAAIRAAVGG